MQAGPTGEKFYVKYSPMLKWRECRAGKLLIFPHVWGLVPTQPVFFQAAFLCCSSAATCPFTVASKIQPFESLFINSSICHGRLLWTKRRMVVHGVNCRQSLDVVWEKLCCFWLASGYIRSIVRYGINLVFRIVLELLSFCSMLDFHQKICTRHCVNFGVG